MPNDSEIRVNDELQNDTFFEDSDDSVKDRDYQVESDEEYSSDDYEQSTQNEANNLEQMNPEEMMDIPQTGRPKKGRKRKFSNQDRNTRKKNKNSNVGYYSAKGKLVNPKQFIDYECSCKNICHTKISTEDRRGFFTEFWNLKDYNTQTTFIGTCVREENVKRKITGAINPEKRKFSRSYHINNTSVCREMFIKTLSISTKRIDTSLKKIRAHSIPDKRGIAGGHNKMSLEQKNDIIAHIRMFPKYKSHYCRDRRNQQEYLPIGITIKKMYELYKGEYENVVSLSAYHKIFLTEFNLKTKSPRKDTCNKCDSYAAKIQNCTNAEEKQKLTSEDEIHKRQAELARARMNSDLALAKEREDTDTLTFDMQKTLPLPRLSTNIIFYKRQLWLYNCGVYSGKNNQSVFNIWLEGQAGRGAQEVASSLRKFIKCYVSPQVKTLNLWSDSCGGQNRNIKMVLILKCVLEESATLESIRLQFLVSGHSFLHNDSDFGDVECAVKRQQNLFTPEDYIAIMQNCRKKNPIIVNQMKKDDFVGTSKIEKLITNRKKDVTDKKVNWLHIKEIKIIKSFPYTMFIRTTYDANEEYQEINIRKGRGKKTENVGIFSKNLSELWPDGKEIPQAKLDDIKSYMHLIPAVAHPFYEKLKGNSAVEEDIEGFNGELDFEIDLL